VGLRTAPARAACPPARPAAGPATAQVMRRPGRSCPAAGPAKREVDGH
jgi:hypothetical protein